MSIWQRKQLLWRRNWLLSNCNNGNKSQELSSNRKQLHTWSQPCSFSWFFFFQPPFNSVCSSTSFWPTFFYSNSILKLAETVSVACHLGILLVQSGWAGTVYRILGSFMSVFRPLWVLRLPLPVLFRTQNTMHEKRKQWKTSVIAIQRRAHLTRAPEIKSWQKKNPDLLWL